MYISHLRLTNFRNYGRLDINFPPGLNLFIGNNAQGKTNLLEAIYFLSTLKSFRGVSTACMIKQNQESLFVSAVVNADIKHDIKIYWSRSARKITLDNHVVKKVGEIYGVVKAVVFCSEDMYLVKGPAQVRRRYTDFILANTTPTYLELLQNYIRAVRARNSILKQPAVDLNLLESFTLEVVKTGEEIMRHRFRLFEELSPIIQESYAKISGSAEKISIVYKPSIKDNFAFELAAVRDRELAMKTTLKGPHRDEIEILINDKKTETFASEGQIRSIAIALKYAQAEYFNRKHGCPPIMLIDDIMGELDQKRRSAFIPLLERSKYMQSQVFMTCTEQNWPTELSKNMQIWKVIDGSIRK